MIFDCFHHIFSDIIKINLTKPNKKYFSNFFVDAENIAVFDLKMNNLTKWNNSNYYFTKIGKYHAFSFTFLDYFDGLVWFQCEWKIGLFLINILKPSGEKK
jgi:hypothetical protein